MPKGIGLWELDGVGFHAHAFGPPPRRAEAAGAWAEARERERPLRGRIDRLERRLALIESTAAPKAPPDPPPNGFTPARSAAPSAQPEPSPSSGQQPAPAVPAPAQS